ncbi:MAG: MFS transporter, partial [Proteobacteria bacterium]
YMTTSYVASPSPSSRNSPSPSPYRSTSTPSPPHSERYPQKSLNSTDTSQNPVSKKRFALLKQYLTQKTMGALMSVYFLSSLAMAGMEATLILYMAERFGWQLKQVSFGFAYIGVITVISQGFLVRRLIPIWGERKTLRWGLIGFALGLTGIAFAPTVPWMGVTMTLLALGTSFTNPATMGSISLLAPAAEQGITMGVAQSLASLGRIVGPALGGLLYESLDIRSPFITSGFLALCGLCLVLTIWKSLPDSGKTI